MATAELACTYASLILSDDGIPITSEKISALVNAANVKVETYWATLFAKLLEKKSVDDLINTVGSGGGGASAAAAADVSAPSVSAVSVPAAAPVAEKEVEESDDDMPLDIFGD